MCVGVPLRGKMQDKLKNGDTFLGIPIGGSGIKISCKDTSDTNSDGKPDCASAGVGGNSQTISNIGSASGCGSVSKTILHEIVHAAGGAGHAKPPNPATDVAYGCEVACYPGQTPNLAGAQAGNCK
jgi:hypothetical protein